MVALPNIGGALCSTPQSLAEAHYYMPCSNAAKTRKPLKVPGVPQTPETISDGRLNGIRQVSPVCTPPTLGLPESTNQTTSRSVQPFLHSSRQCRRACPGMFFPLKIALWHGAIWNPIKYLVPCAHPSRHPKQCRDWWGAKNGRFNRIRQVAPMFTPV